MKIRFFFFFLFFLFQKSVFASAMVRPFATLSLGIAPTDIAGVGAEVAVAEDLYLDLGMSLSGGRTQYLGYSPSVQVVRRFERGGARAFNYGGGFFTFFGQGKRGVAFSKRCDSRGPRQYECDSHYTEGDPYVYKTQVRWRFIYLNAFAGFVWNAGKSLLFRTDLGWARCVYANLQLRNQMDPELGDAEGITVGEGGMFTGRPVVEQGDQGPYISIGFILDAN